MESLSFTVNLQIRGGHRNQRNERSVIAPAIYSEPMRAPFSATERFMTGTNNKSENVNAAKNQKLSK
jgi:hypothetical protein